ncbi:hypothetical protein IFM89_036544 [Coptis chinensis]|uniref:Solute carrier family 40 member n=1 Tax=Coptis chinensis TaxID=261450 RepID=A0A835LTS7_9MAGN|nr:hypothetical protein IFM89_036544 [Coptis chinensis]
MRQPLLLGDSSSQQQQKQPEHLQEKTSYSTLIKYLMWEFSVALYMINVWPDSLLFTALYGVVEAASTALFGPIVGRWVDRFTYVQVLRMWLFTQNLSFIVAGGTVTVLLVYSSLRFTSFPAFMSLIILTNISGAVGVLSTLAGTILVEREWIVVISSGKSPETLTEMNSVIRRIDLACNLFAPVVSGFIISFVSLKDSAITFTVWNLVSVSLIYWLLISVYNGIPTLSENNEKRKARHSQNDTVKSSSSLEGNKKFLSHDETDLESGQKCNWKEKLVEQFLRVPYVESWTVYLQQDVVLPGIALAILYFTVLSFGSLMTATLEWEGTPAFVIGSMRGVSATIGIAATLLYPILHSRISTLRTGLWSIWMQWTFLLVCVASIWVRNSRLSAWLLMGGVATSRLGLWMFDLSVMQQMQDLVPDSDRCIVGGVQNSLQSMFDLLTYVMGIIISNPQVVELKVGMHCEQCIKKIMKTIKKIEDIETYDLDVKLNKITVTGNVTSEEVIRVLQKIGKTASNWEEIQSLSDLQ